MDETGLGLGVCNNERVIGTSKTKRSYNSSPESREWVTVLETISATGHCTKPVVIFTGGALQTSWFPANEVPDWHFTSSENGWTSNTKGLRWLKEVFLKETDPGKNPDGTTPTRLLLLDNHDSHIQADFMYEAYRNNVYLVYLVPHTSYATQPLDLGPFSKTKSQYRTEINRISRYDDSEAVKKIRFVSVYHQARERGFINDYILAGWKAAGIRPWNPRKVLRSHQLLQNSQPQPPQTPQISRTTSNALLMTPTTHRDVEKQLDVLGDPDTTPVTRRTIQAKISRGFQGLTMMRAQNELQIEQQGGIINEYKTRKSKKVAINSNDTFANIDIIHKAQEQAREKEAAWQRRQPVEEARRQSEILQQRQQEEFMSVWDLKDGCI